MLERLKTLVRYPTLIIDFGETLMVFLVSFGLALSQTQQTYIIAVLVAALGLAKSFMVHPFAPNALVDFGRAALMLGISFGLHVNAAQVGVGITLLGTLLTAVLTNQTTPLNDPAPNFPGLPASARKRVVHHTTSQRGAVDLLFVIGVVLVILGLLGLILIAVHNSFLPLVWCIILTVVGAIIAAVGRGRTVL